MSGQTTNALLAIALGCVLATFLIVPVAAVRYRRVGTFTLRDLVVLFGVAVYGVALWTYTLLPLPTGDYRCTRADLHPFDFVPLLEAHAAQAGVRGLLRDPAFMQLALNVLLFVPLGFFMRWVLGARLPLVGVVGLGVSALIETTQLTGIWGIYDCAYRVFDVNDIITNTAGTLIGAVLALPAVHHRRRARPRGDRVTLGRRLVGMICDVLVVVLSGAVPVIAYRAWILYGAHGRLGDIDGNVQTALQWGLPALLETGCVLGRGQTVGELVVCLQPVPQEEGTTTTAAARLIKLLTGVGGFIALGWAPFPGSGVALAAFIAVTLLAAMPRDHRGLTHWLARMRLIVVPAQSKPRAEPQVSDPGRR